MEYKFDELTKKEKNSLPDTYGTPLYDKHTMEKEDCLWDIKEKQYDLSFDSVKYELEAAFNIGLENYGSGIASWKIPEILNKSCCEYLDSCLEYLQENYKPEEWFDFPCSEYDF